MTQKERTAHWSAIVERQAASGMSGLAWCRENQIKPASFYIWRRKLNGAQNEKGFIELHAFGGSGIRIGIGPNLFIEVERGFDPATLCAVIETICNNFPCSA